MSKCKYVSPQKAYEILDDNWTKLDNPRYDDYELTQALILVIKALDREESVLKALEDVKAEIAEYGSIWVGYTIKGHTDRDIQRTIEDVIKQAKTQVLDIIDRKIAEAKGDKPFRYAKEIIEAQSPLSEGVNGEEFEKWLREGDKE